MNGASMETLRKGDKVEVSTKDGKDWRPGAVEQVGLTCAVVKLQDGDFRIVENRCLMRWPVGSRG